MAVVVNPGLDRSAPLFLHASRTMSIIPVLKKSTVSYLNDYRSVALASIMMKCFERLVMRHIKTQLPPSLDPMQFTYRPNCYTNAAITTTFHLALTHLDNKDSYISTLGAVGGQNTKRVTWNILSRLFTDAVAKQINWKGVNGKKSFKEMLTRCLLIKGGGDTGKVKMVFIEQPEMTGSAQMNGSGLCSWLRMMLDLTPVFIPLGDRGCRQTWSGRDTMTFTGDKETRGITRNAGDREVNVRRVLELSITGSSRPNSKENDIFTSYSRTTSTGATQGRVLSPLLFSLYTNDCTSTDPSVKLLKFADDTTVIGLIQDGDESAYRQEIEQLAAWCSLNDLELNTLKTVKMIVDFRRNTPAPPHSPS
ncbi:hypothetical protein QTP70_001344 [Hemibagrus guttatus]|uniref:Reverse transcriptase domain-containing protein n=1 Tax=Hemibagrus guttatus TaxID=175788 RepID=A0AAE0RFX0_9TELE|nr:hypothetical protein QTP70_001344 [Hemibagrus guttatus]